MPLLVFTVFQFLLRVGSREDSIKSMGASPYCVGPHRRVKKKEVTFNLGAIKLYSRWNSKRSIFWIKVPSYVERPLVQELRNGTSSTGCVCDC